MATDGNFSFTRNGKKYTFEKSFSVVRTPRWLQENRRRDELDLAFTILETIAGDEALEAILDMTESEFQTFSKRLGKEMSDFRG